MPIVKLKPLRQALQKNSQSNWRGKILQNFHMIKTGGIVGGRIAIRISLLARDTIGLLANGFISLQKPLTQQHNLANSYFLFIIFFVSFTNTHTPCVFFECIETNSKFFASHFKKQIAKLLHCTRNTSKKPIYWCVCNTKFLLSWMKHRLKKFWIFFVTMMIACELLELIEVFVICILLKLWSYLS